MTSILALWERIRRVKIIKFLYQCFSAEGNFVSQETLGNVRRHFDCHTGTWVKRWLSLLARSEVEARVDAKHNTMYTAAPAPLPCPRHSHTQIIWPEVVRVSKLRNPALDRQHLYCMYYHLFKKQISNKVVKQPNQS